MVVYLFSTNKKAKPKYRGYTLSNKIHKCVRKYYDFDVIKINRDDIKNNEIFSDIYEFYYNYELEVYTNTELMCEFGDSLYSIDNYVVSFCNSIYRDRALSYFRDDSFERFYYRMKATLVKQILTTNLSSIVDFSIDDLKDKDALYRYFPDLSDSDMIYGDLIIDCYNFKKLYEMKFKKND